MSAPHAYRIELEWTGSRGAGTRSYSAYGRDHSIRAAGKPPLLLSSDPAFRGDATRYNPEEMVVAALSSCHMLSYLALCARQGIEIVAYRDTADGAMRLNPDGSGQLTEVTLHPEVTIASGDLAQAEALHSEAHRVCFIARSVNFPVRHLPKLVRA